MLDQYIDRIKDKELRNIREINEKKKKKKKEIKEFKIKKKEELDDRLFFLKVASKCFGGYEEKETELKRKNTKNY